MKNRLLLFSILLLICSNTIEVSAQNIVRNFILRSKEKVKYTETVIEKKKIGEGWSEEFKDVEKTDYEEFLLNVALHFSTEAYKHKDNPFLQEDLVKAISATKKHSSPMEIKVCDLIKNEKTTEGIFAKLKTLKDYNVFSNDEMESYIAEFQRYPNCKRSTKTVIFNFEVENGILKSELPFIYDAENGKRILVTDLLEQAKRKGTKCVITGIKSIESNYIMFEQSCADPSWDKIQIEKDDPTLTPYAKSLMEKVKDYKIFTIQNIFGDYIQEFNFKRLNGSYERKKVLLPEKLNNCNNTEKIRKRMLEVMFGKSDGDVEALVTEGVKKWVLEHGRGSDMLFMSGLGLVSFGFEDQSVHNNSKNTFIVFDKTTGEEISVKDLIKDKDGFLKFVNSHNYYMAGFIFDSTNIERNKKYGSSFRSYIRHSGGYFGKFDGLKEFPTSWWFAFNKMDGLIPIEFNTTKNRIFLDYDDIRKYIDPKYLDLMDKATKAIVEN